MRKNYNFMAIYAIINIFNDKMYVGSAKNFRLRRNLHLHKLSANVNDSKHLQYAYNYYGKDKFIFTILEKIHNKDDLLTREQYWIDILDTTNQDKGYNLRKIASSNLGIFVKQSTRDKLSKFQTGKTRSEETREKIRSALLNQKRKPHSEETKAKMRLAALGKPKSEAHKEAMRGKTRSEQARINISKGKAGKKASEETRAKLSLIQLERQRKIREKNAEYKSEWVSDIK